MKTVINKDVISKLKPCKDRYDNYLKRYKDKSFTQAQFMRLTHITQADKLWVAFRLMSKDNARLAAIDIAAARGGDKASAACAVDAAVSAASANAAAFSAYAAICAICAVCAICEAYASAYHTYTTSACASAYAVICAICAAYAGFSAGRIAKQEKLVHKILLKYWKQ